MKKLQIYIKKNQGEFHIIGVLQGKDIYFLGKVREPIPAFRVAINQAKALGVSKEQIYYQKKKVKDMILF